jgi:exodeoxyribonuclease-3
MTWNVSYGGEDRFDAILHVVASARPDVLVLQECVGWEGGERLAMTARVLGIEPSPTSTFLGLSRPRHSGKRYHIGVVSRFPMRPPSTCADPKKVGHAIVDTVLAAPGGNVTLLATHFDSYSEDERLRDARTLIGIAPAERLANERVLLAGDLNALSPRDPYPVDLGPLLRAAGVEKYGVPPRFEAVPLLERTGFIDLLHHHDTVQEWVTAVREHGGVRLDYRTDYLMASKSLAEHLVSIEVLSSETASDHEPVRAVFT